MKEKKKIATDIYSKINMTPQTFSDNMMRLANGNFPKLDFLIDIQRELKIDLGLNF